MITRKLGLRISKSSMGVVAMLAVGLPLALTRPSGAQTFWSSTNTVDGMWSDPTTWSNNLATVAAPTAGGSANYIISFDGGTAINSTNDLGTAANNGFLLNQLVYSATAASSTLLGSNLVFATSTGGALPQVIRLSANNATLSTDGVILNTNTTFTGAGTGSLTITSVVSGVGGLTVNGSYTVVLRASTNTYAGDTVISSGALQSGINAQSVDPLPFGPGKGNVIINSGGTLFINNVNTSMNGLSGSGIVDRNSAAGNTRSITVGYGDVSSMFSGTIQNNGGGTLSLTKVGAGQFTLTGTNTFGGLTGIATILSGQVVVASSMALSNISVATSNDVGGIVFSNVTAAYFGALGPIGNPSTSSAGIGLTNTAGQAVTLYVGSNRGSFTTYSGQLSGSGTFVKVYPTYTLRVQGTNAVHTGDTLINEGTLDVNFGGWFPYGPGVGNLFVGATGVVGLRTPANGGVYNVNGLSGSGTIEGFNLAGTKSLVVGNNNATSLFSGSILNSDPVIATNGPVALTKVGTGTLSLSGTNQYTQGTTISAGVLALVGDGSIDDSASINLATGAMLDVSGHTGGGTTIGAATNVTLRGFGGIKGNITLGSLATMAPGTNAAPGTLTFSNNLVISSAATLTFHAGAATDMAVVGGNLTLDGTLNILDGGGITNGVFTLLTYGGTLTTNGSPTILTIGSVPDTNLTYTINIAALGLVRLIVSSGAPADPFTVWESHYFPGGGPNAAAGADPDGDGVSNTNEFLAGFNPINSSAYPHIISITKTNTTDINVIYLGANGDSTWSPGIASRTNVLEFTTGTANGSYSNNFVSTGQTNILSGGTGVGVVANMIDSGGATNKPSRFYRIRVLAP